MEKILKKKNFVLLYFFLFFWITLFFLGYSSLNRFDHDFLMNTALSDITFYESIIKNGIEQVKVSERIGPRILVPLLSHYVYINIGDLGTWNKVFFSLLIVNSFLISLITIYQIKFLKLINAPITLYPQFLFISSFAVVNIYLTGLIDSSICLFSFLYIYYSLKEKYIKSLVVILFLALSKETSFIYVILINLSIILNIIFLKKKLSFLIISRKVFDVLLIIILVNFTISFFLKMNLYSYSNTFINNSGISSLSLDLLDFIKIIFFILFIPFFIFFNNKFKNETLSLFFIMTIISLIFFSILTKVSGPEIGRYYFNLAGPFSCIFVGLGLQSFIKKFLIK